MMPKNAGRLLESEILKLCERPPYCTTSGTKTSAQRARAYSRTSATYFDFPIQGATDLTAQKNLEIAHSKPCPARPPIRREGPYSTFSRIAIAETWPFPNYHGDGESELKSWVVGKADKCPLNGDRLIGRVIFSNRIQKTCAHRSFDETKRGAEGRGFGGVPTTCVVADLILPSSPPTRTHHRRVDVGRLSIPKHARIERNTECMGGAQHSKSYDSHMLAVRFVLVTAILLGSGQPAVRLKDDFDTDRARMVDQQIAARGIRNRLVLDAMKTVPRHEFVPEAYRKFAYIDSPLPIGLDQTISQPYIVAVMTELLDPKPEHRVLEIGTGSGYQAAVISLLVKEVYTIEIIPQLAESARQRLQQLGFSNVTVRQGDGYQGWPEKTPFDGILVTAGATEVPRPLVDQLKRGGRIVIPVGSNSDTQVLKIVEKRADGSTRTREVIPVRFVPLRRK